MVFWDLTIRRFTAKVPNLSQPKTQRPTHPSTIKKINYLAAMLGGTRSIGRVLGAAPGLSRGCLSAFRAGSVSHNLNMSRSYSSEESELSTRERILRTGLEKVPSEGFENALMLGIREAGYSDITHNLFPGGAFDLVKYHLETTRNDLQNVELSNEADQYKRLLLLLQHRLKANSAIQPRLSEAISIMTLPQNVPTSLSELHELSDELWYLSNDRTSDFSWYTKRAALSSVYVASELFMAQDQSTEYRDTLDFAAKRLQEIEATGYASDSTLEWLKFNTIASFNVLKSLTRA